MATITVRVTKEEKEFLSKMAEFENRSLSELLKKYTLESLEDIYDAQIGDLAYEEYLEDPVTRPLSQVIKEYDI